MLLTGFRTRHEINYNINRGECGDSFMEYKEALKININNLDTNLLKILLLLGADIEKKQKYYLVKAVNNFHFRYLFKIVRYLAHPTTKNILTLTNTYLKEGIDIHIAFYLAHLKQSTISLDYYNHSRNIYNLSISNILKIPLNNKIFFKKISNGSSINNLYPIEPNTLLLTEINQLLAEDKTQKAVEIIKKYGQV